MNVRNSMYRTLSIRYVYTELYGFVMSVRNSMYGYIITIKIISDVPNSIFSICGENKSSKSLLLTYGINKMWPYYALSTVEKYHHYFRTH